MSNKINQKKNKNPSKKESKVLSFFKYFLLLISLIIIGLFSLYEYLHIKEGFTIYFSNYDIQTEYARFLIEINDDFVDKMVLFENITRNKESYEDYAESEKEQLTNIILAENTILSRLDNTSPNDSNLDYNELYENVLQSYALYIQGQLMKMEYILQTDVGLSYERYKLGDSVTNLIGNFIIEYGELSNKVRTTTYECKYKVLDGLDYNLGTAEDVDIERDEDGNIILDEDKTYLYLPEDENTTTKESNSSLQDENVSITNKDLENYINGFMNIQNNN